jgi:hypothetical protein
MEMTANHRMKNATLLLLLLVIGCSKKIQTDADGTPQFPLTAQDMASPVAVITDGKIEMSATAQTNTNGMAVVEWRTNNAPGVASLRFELTTAKLKELRKFLHYVDVRSMDTIPGVYHARAEVLVGTNVVYDSLDFRITGGVWIAAGGMALIFKSPAEAQAVADVLSHK